MRIAHHLQTATAAIPFVTSLPAGMTSEIVELALGEGPDADGELVVIAEWQRGPAPAIIVVHGVGGSSDDAYVRRGALAFARAGFHVVRVNQRGSGRGAGKAPALYHAALSDDLALVQRWLEARDDVTDIGLLGFSLGGSVSLTYAALLAGQPTGKLRAVVSISSPIDLAATMREFDNHRRSPAAIYEHLVLRSLLDNARLLMTRQSGRVPFDARDLASIDHIRGFDERVTCRIHGFRDIVDYHARASVVGKLGAIELPTLIIHAEDDPIVPVEPLLRAARSPAVDVVVTPHGGHVGFVEKISELWGATSAVARAAAHFDKHIQRPKR